MKKICLIICLALMSISSFADQSQISAQTEVVASQTGKATYLGNEAIMLEAAGQKVLFDPFFHNVFDTYQLVPDQIIDALMNGIAPYDNIDAIFISHAHGDHFFADDLVKFLSLHSSTQLIAPSQAVEQMADSKKFDKIKNQITSIALSYQDPPIQKTIAGLSFDVVRIPHAGWPQRAKVSNLVYRVQLANNATVIHMGDADPDDSHFKPLIAHWQNQKTNTAFPPYWFFSNAEGQMILSERISADKNIGIHVPVQVPADLKASGARYFSDPGEVYKFSEE